MSKSLETKVAVASRNPGIGGGSGKIGNRWFRRPKTEGVSYWVSTGILVTECSVGGVMGALPLPPFIGVIHLGYPRYFMTILGLSYVLAGLALLAPGVSRLKERAYAGLVSTTWELPHRT